MSHFHSSSRNSDGNTISILPSIYKERRKSFLEVLNNILHDFEQLKRENIIKEIEKTIIDNLTSEKENFMMKALNMIADEINQNKRSLQKIHNTQKSIQKNYYKQNPSTLSRINSQNINKTTICKIRNEISELQLTISNDFSSFQSSLSDAKFKILESLQCQKLKNQSLKRKNSHLKMIIKEKKRQVDDICSSYDSFFEDDKNLNFEPMHFTSPNSPSKSYHFTSSSSIQKGPRFTSRSSSSLTSVSESDFSDLSCIESEKEKRFNQLEMQIQQNNLEIQELRNLILQKDSIISSQEQSIRMIENERNEPHAINNLLSDLQQKTSKIESILLKECSHGSNFAVNQENEKLKKQLIKEKKKVHDLKNERRGFDQQINDYKKKIYEYENRLKLLSNSECKDPNHKNLIYKMEQLKIQNSNNKKDLIEAQTIAKKYKEQKIALQKELDKVKEENTILKINIQMLFKEQSPSPQKQLPFSDEKEHVKCTVCKKVIIDEKELVVLKNNPYHKKCVKCMSCEHPFNLPDQENEIIFINSTTFLCEDHYKEYQEEELPENIQKVYQKETKDNLVKVLFDNNDFFSKNEIIDQPPENVFISEELIKDSYQIKKPYELIVPTAKCHIEMPAEEIDYELVKKCLGDNLVIVGVNKGSTILTLALIGMKNIDDKIYEKFQSIINKFKDKVQTTMGQTVVSNFRDVEIKVPNPEEINQLLRKPSINILQNAAEIENINLDDCKEIIINNLSNERNVDWKFLFNQQNLFHEFEQKLKDDIKKNPFEVILIGETVIANKYFNEFEKIRKKLSENASCEFVYHGSMLANHCKIVQEHFKNKMTTDKGFYGKGIYATDNLFYAAYYANKLHYLKIKEKTYIIACAAIYNQSEVKEITDMSYFGQTIKSDTKENYGIHKALVGNTKNFYPIWPNEKERNDIVAEEYVFPQKYQICPILSLMIMRTDHFILWKDDHIHNDENSKYLEEISKKTEINFYQEDSNDRALDFIKLKKRNKIKLITNGGDNGNSRILIQDARKIIRSDFVCLVFARSNSHKDWVTKMTNVLFTTDPEDFKKFVALKMDQKDILGFINYLQEKHTDTKFIINESELLKFPLASKPIK